MKVEMKGFLMARKSSRYNSETGKLDEHLVYSFSHYDSSDYDKDNVCIGPYSFEADVPDEFDVRSGLVANLERDKKKLQAEFQKRLTELNAQIQSLLAIEA